MVQEIVFNDWHNNYSVGKYYFQTNKVLININEVDIKRIVLFNKVFYGKQGANKYYVGYVWWF